MSTLSTARCARAVSLFRGLYARVARNLGVDVSYISRIAHGKRKSKLAEKALTKEFNKVVTAMRNGRPHPSRKFFVAVTLQCPGCKTLQKIQIAAGTVFRHAGGEMVSCINCNKHFKVTIPDRIIRGPLSA
jgi:Zn ribbon nucleic-acid-binding protein